MLEITGRAAPVTGKEQGLPEHRGFDRHVKEPAGGFYAPSGSYIATIRIAVESVDAAGATTAVPEEAVRISAWR